MNELPDTFRAIAMAIAGTVILVISGVIWRNGEVNLNKNPTPNDTLVRYDDTPLLFVAILMVIVTLGVGFLFAAWKTWRQQPLFGKD